MSVTPDFLGIAFFTFYLLSCTPFYKLNSQTLSWPFIPFETLDSSLAFITQLTSTHFTSLDPVSSSTNETFKVVPRVDSELLDNEEGAVEVGTLFSMTVKRKYLFKRKEKGPVPKFLKEVMDLKLDNRDIDQYSRSNFIKYEQIFCICMHCFSKQLDTIECKIEPSGECPRNSQFVLWEESCT